MVYWWHQWKSDQRGNIENHYGYIGDCLLFTACRFKDDPWILTSNTFNMPMMHPESLEVCKGLASSMLMGFIQHVLEDEN